MEMSPPSGSRLSSTPPYCIQRTLAAATSLLALHKGENCHHEAGHMYHRSPVSEHNFQGYEGLKEEDGTNSSMDEDPPRLQLRYSENIARIMAATVLKSLSDPNVIFKLSDNVDFDLPPYPGASGDIGTRGRGPPIQQSVSDTPPRDPSAEKRLQAGKSTRHSRFRAKGSVASKSQRPSRISISPSKLPESASVTLARRRPPR